MSTFQPWGWRLRVRAGSFLPFDHWDVRLVQLEGCWVFGTHRVACVQVSSVAEAFRAPLQGWAAKPPDQTSKGISVHRGAICLPSFCLCPCFLNP